MAVLGKNTTYGQIVDLIRSKPGMQDNPFFSDALLVKEINNEISNLYAKKADKGFYQKRETYSLSGSSNPYHVDLSSTIPFPYKIVDVVYKGSGRTSIKQVSQIRLEEELQLTNINTNSIYCSIGGDAIDFSFGSDISVVTADAIEVVYQRQPTLPTIQPGKVFSVDTSDSLTTSLVTYCKLEDATDYWGQNDPTNINSVTFVPGKVSNCASFDGATNYLHWGAPLSTQLNNVSMFMWVYIPTDSEKGCFFHNGRDGDAAGGAHPTNGYSIGVGGTTLDNVGNNLIGLLDGIRWLDFEIAIGTGWHSVCMTRSSTFWRGYVDAVVGTVAINANPFAPTTEALLGVNSPVFPAPGSPRYFNGKIDEFGFWNKQLTQQEITDLHNSGNGQTMSDILDGCPDIMDYDITIAVDNLMRNIRV